VRVRVRVRDRVRVLHGALRGGSRAVEHPEAMPPVRYLALYLVGIMGGGRR
jgi:hypothetical protein